MQLMQVVQASPAPHSPGEVHASGEQVHICPLLASVVDADLRVGHTTAVARLGVGLTLLLAVATRWAATHCCRLCCVACV